ncbi:MAG: aminotransferase class V-fold PLP-dependent enzyme [Fimbriimonadales bacterium]|nr:aminotransferase class V-fold PLP-dependent enzyme [Fimbriimonadales bacterium]
MANPLRCEVLGADAPVPLLDGSTVPYANFDNAASTPCLRTVWQRLSEFLPWYSSVHRGSGYKSRLSTVAYDRAREAAGEFVGADPSAHTVVFVKNTTEAVNKLAHRLRLRPGATVLTTAMEHHSNDLPWRARCRVGFLPVRPEDGTLDADAAEAAIRAEAGRLALVAATGASNVTGNVNPFRRLARAAHEAGALFLLDAAQLAPHRPIDMLAPDDPERIDFVVYSAHKMYAPFGSGVLVARRDALDDERGPDQRGGGTVRVVTHDHVGWADTPEVDEAGSPNVVGAVALHEAIRFYRRHGFGLIEQTENRLAARLLRGLLAIPGVTVYGRSDPEDFENRLAVVPFNVQGVPHALAAAVLAYEHGIGVRAGCFCAHPYVKTLLRVGPDEERRMVAALMADDRSRLPGAVRASFGFYNEDSEVDRLLEAVARLARGEIRGEYRLDRAAGEYVPARGEPDYSQSFALACSPRWDRVPPC